MHVCGTTTTKLLLLLLDKSTVVQVGYTSHLKQTIQGGLDEIIHQIDRPPANLAGNKNDA